MHVEAHKSFGADIPTKFTGSHHTLGGIFLLANSEIEENAFINAFEIYASVPGEIELWILKFNNCGKSISCAVFLQTLALGSLDNIPKELNRLNKNIQEPIVSDDFKIHARTILNLDIGYKMYKLDMPIYVSAGSIIYLKQISSGGVAIDTSGTSVISDLYISINADENVTHLINKDDSGVNWRFYEGAVGKPFK